VCGSILTQTDGVVCQHWKRVEIDIKSRVLDAARNDLMNGLVCGSVLSQIDGVVCEHWKEHKIISK
jgi:hypothetical protein